MSKIQRYGFGSVCIADLKDGSPTVHAPAIMPRDDGEYVSVSDYDALLIETEALRLKLLETDRLRKQLEQVQCYAAKWMLVNAGAADGWVAHWQGDLRRILRDVNKALVQ